ncbi:unnamed protein product [Orchesella dallaii]|uniref:Uncharacterized protein n=1 Tax=Orchesella dallaii TaxID=48710 RepID=A0ABP1Q9N1_9HEXA
MFNFNNHFQSGKGKDKVTALFIILRAILVLVFASFTQNYSATSETFPVTVFSNRSSPFCVAIWGSINTASDFSDTESFASKLRLLDNIYDPIFDIFLVKWSFDVCVDCRKFASIDEISKFSLNLHETGNFDCLTMENKPNFKFVIFDFYATLQTDLDHIFRNYSQKRNYHSNPPLYGPFYVTSKILSDAVNATLLVRAEAEAENISSVFYPLVSPTVQIYEMGGTPLIKFWEKYKRRSVHIARLTSLGFNFAYCSHPNVILEKAWNISVLVNAFDFKVWLTLFLAIFLISLKLATKLLNGVLLLQYRTFGSVIFKVSSAIIASVGNTQKSSLFLLWLFMCTVLVNYYTGSITSKLISPPEEETMTEISQVLKNNYSIIFEDIVHLGTVKATVQSYAQESNDHKSNVRKDLQSVHSLLNRLSRKSLIQDHTEYVRNVSYSEKVVILYIWPFIMKTVSDANNLIAKEQPKASERRHCYIGKEIIPSGEVFFGFGNHGSERLQGVFQSSYEAGLHLYWMSEFVHMSYAKRVQDRLKVVSPTHIKYDFISTVSALRMEGKVLTVFFVWAVCLAICAVSSVLEMFYSLKNDI